MMLDQDLDRGIVETPACGKLLTQLFMHTARRPCNSKRNIGGSGYHSCAPPDVNLHLDVCSSSSWTSELLPIAAKWVHNPSVIHWLHNAHADSSCRNRHRLQFVPGYLLRVDVFVRFEIDLLSQHRDNVAWRRSFIDSGLDDLCGEDAGECTKPGV